MNIKNNNELREKAMQILSMKSIDTSQWGNDIKRLIEELSIYQIELEHQNEELIHSQLELENSKASYADLFENAPIGYILIDKDRIIVNANNTFCNMMHQNKEDVQGNNIEKYISPLYQDVFHHFFRILQKGEMSNYTELKFRTSRLKEIYVKIDAMSTKSGDFRMAITDISLLKRLEYQLRSETEKLQISEAKFRQIIERTEDAFFYQSIDTQRFEYVSPKIKDIIGYTDDEIMRMDEDNISALLLPKYRFEYSNLINNLITLSEISTERKSITREFRMHTKEDEIKWIRGSFILIKDSKGTPTQVLGCIRDITESKRYELELIAAKNKAEESDKLKSAFLANISHEIRTPMNGIIGFSRVLKDKIDPNEANYEYISIIEKSSNRLLELINDLISISKIESNQVQVKKTKFDFHLVLDECHKLFDLEAKEHNLDFRLIVPNEPIELYTDKEKVTSVIYNLIKNAIKFTHKGFVEFGTEIRGNNLYFFVKDTGRGIPKEKYNLMFKRFTQVYSS